MTENRFSICFILALLVQLVLTKYCQWPFVYICILPAMILCMPTARPGWWIMVAAFLAGFAVDALADGPLGLNAIALVPVAALQKTVIRLVIDEDVVERHYSLSFRSNGYIRLGIALAIVYAIFFIIYVFIDSAGIRNFGFNFTKLLLSILASLVFGMITIAVLCPYQRK